MGVVAGGLLSKAHQIVNGFVSLVGFGVVIRQTVIDILQPGSIEALQGLPGGGMQGLAPGRQQALVGHVLRQGVLEDIRRFLCPGLLIDKFEPL
jgi:hypothetical protein